MKKVLLVALLLLSTISYANGDSTKKSESIEFQKVNDYVDGVITGLSKHLKVPAEHVYKVIVNQQRIVGISHILFLCITFIVIISFILTLQYYTKRTQTKGDILYNEEDCAGIVISWIIIVVGTCVFLAYFGSYFTEMWGAFFNPEYNAIKDITKMINS